MCALLFVVVFDGERVCTYSCEVLSVLRARGTTADRACGKLCGSATTKVSVFVCEFRFAY